MDQNQLIADVVDHLNTEFGDFAPEKGGSRDRAIRRIKAKAVHPERLREAAKNISRDWEKNRSPTLHDFLLAIDAVEGSYQGRDKIEAVQGGANGVRAKYSDVMLGMSARPSSTLCGLCYDEFVGRGVKESDPLLWHEHFSIADFDANVALEVAVMIARDKAGHALEKKCRPMTIEERERNAARMRSMALSMASPPA